MARARTNGHERLEEAIAILIQNQASFLSRNTEIDRISSERFARIEDRLSRIESILIDHSHVLADHARLLQGLTDAVREKIGFKPLQQPKPTDGSSN